MIPIRTPITLRDLGIGLAVVVLVTVAFGAPSERRATRTGQIPSPAVKPPVRPWGLGSIFVVGGGLAWLISKVQQGERLGDPTKPIPSRGHRIREDLRWTARLVGTVGAVVVAGIPWMVAEFDARHSPGPTQGWYLAAGGIIFWLAGAILTVHWWRRWARLPPLLLPTARPDPKKLATKLPQPAGLWDHDLDGH